MRADQPLFRGAGRPPSGAHGLGRKHDAAQWRAHIHPDIATASLRRATRGLSQSARAGRAYRGSAGGNQFRPVNDELIRKHEGHFTRLTLNRPHKANALSASLVEALLNAVEYAYTDGTRLMIIDAAGAHFCAGF